MSLIVFLFWPMVKAGKECSELNQELRELETKSDLTNHCASAVNEALQLYDNSSAHDMFQGKKYNFLFSD